MPTPPLSDEKCIEALEAHRQHYSSRRDAAAALGIPVETLRHRLEVARKRGLHLSSGIRAQLDQSGISGTEALMGWRHSYNDKGKKVGTTFWRAPELPEDQLADYLSSVRDALDGITPAPVFSGPESTIADEMTLYPLMDVHFGMMAWGQETGDVDYDIKLALSDVRASLPKVLRRTPKTSTGVLVVGGDFFHTDDSRNETPANRHKLDADGRHLKIMLAGNEFLYEFTQSLLSHHDRVVIRVMRGNHDEHSHIIPMVGLTEKFKGHDRCKVMQSARDLFTYTWGNTLINVHHGDKGKPEALVGLIADICPEWVGGKQHRFVFTGHTHYERSRDISGARWESLRPFSPKDAYGARYPSRRSMYSLTFHNQDGLVARAFDPINRG